MKINPHYQRPNASCWQGRKDNENIERFFQAVKLLDGNKLDSHSFDEQTVVFIGFASDLGVKRNQGRVGASKGPDALRHALANYPLHEQATKMAFVDIGNITCSDNLEEAQQALAAFVSEVLKRKAFPIVLGGGHETSWGHYLGLKPFIKDERFAILNFDAHFDMRPVLEDGQGSSGTAFLQIANERLERNLSFDYYCIGIQKSANTKSLFETASEWGVNYLSYDEISDFPHHATSFVQSILTKYDQIYVTLCLDVFATNVAPGVSAMSPNGLLPSQVIPLLRQLAQSGKVIAFDIVELSPPLDINGMTAKLGAYCLVEFLYPFTRANSG